MKGRTRFKNRKPPPLMLMKIALEVEYDKKDRVSFLKCF